MMRCLLALVLVASDCAAGTEASVHDGCLYSFGTGEQVDPVYACDDADPRELARAPDIDRVIQTFGLDRRKIRFKGCKEMPFSARQAEGGNGKEIRYLITYPSETAESYIAPITHELAHVLQMEMAGGLVPLKKAFSSKRVELGADYLTGIIFTRVLNDINLNSFQTNLSLVGLYRERDDEAHGTPEQRTASFRRGVHMHKFEAEQNIRRASTHFQKNIYGTVISH